MEYMVLQIEDDNAGYKTKGESTLAKAMTGIRSKCCLIAGMFRTPSRQARATRVEQQVGQTSANW